MSYEYQILSRIQTALNNARTRVLQVRSRVGLPAATPLLDRVQNIVSQRAAGGGILGRPLAPPAPAPAPTPATTATQYGYEMQALPPEETGVEAR